MKTEDFDKKKLEFFFILSQKLVIKNNKDTRNRLIMPFYKNSQYFSQIKILCCNEKE